MTNYTELERLAYISGQPGLADLYDKAAVLEGIDLDEITEKAYKKGYRQGKKDASDDELLEEIAGLKAQVETLNTALSAMYTSYSNFLKWLQTDPAKQIATRREAIRNMERQILSWRAPRLSTTKAPVDNPG